MHKLTFAGIVLMFCGATLLGQVASPPDVLGSLSYPEDLVKGLSKDVTADHCWNDEVDGSNYAWNKNGNPPVVQYTYKFRNTCKRALTCTLVIASGTKLRDKDKREGSWRPYRADRKSFTIKPGEAVTVSGTLQWLATPDRLPSINDDVMPCWFQP